jgi:hypothetical protein
MLITSQLLSNSKVHRTDIGRGTYTRRANQGVERGSFLGLWLTRTLGGRVGLWRKGARRTFEKVKPSVKGGFSRASHRANDATDGGFRGDILGGCPFSYLMVNRGEGNSTRTVSENKRMAPALIGPRMEVKNMGHRVALVRWSPGLGKPRRNNPVDSE